MEKLVAEPQHAALCYVAYRVVSGTGLFPCSLNSSAVSLATSKPRPCKHTGRTMLPHMLPACLRLHTDPDTWARHMAQS
jgi:hypothetical protein